MKPDKLFSSLNILLDNIEGTNLLLEYFTEFSKKMVLAPDFKTVLNYFHEQLRKIYANQHIEFILWQNNQRIVKFVYNEVDNRVSPVEEFAEVNTLYNYVLEKQQTVLTNNYSGFCENLGVSDCALNASSWLGIPMSVRGKVLGMVVIWDDNRERYLRLQDKQFLSVASDLAGSAIENIYLYNYIVEKNGSYKVFETVLPSKLQRNSIKNVTNHLLDAVIQSHHAGYTGIFIRSQHHNKWRLLAEKFGKDPFSRLGLGLIGSLVNLNENQFAGTDFLFWHRQFRSHPLTAVFGEALEEYPLNSVILFPFMVERSYFGVWLMAFNRNDEQPSREELQLYQFISYILVQLIEKKSLIERKNKYEVYMKHLENMKTMGEVASGSAHHLNNVLSVILAKSQIMQKKVNNPAFLRDLKTIEKVAEDGAKAVRRLRSLTLDSGKKGKWHLLNINELVQEVVEIARPRFEREAQSLGIVYDLKLNLGKVYPVQGDSSLLREALLNLINNALDAMAKGGQLSIQTTAKGNDVLIFVSDTGIGIPENLREKIFEPFFTTKGEKGNGLGLSIVSDTISQHKGKVYVDSIPGKGSIFMVELPAVKDKELQAPPQEAARPELNFKVLLVDDEGVVRETLAEMLEDDGCEVTMARSADDAILKFQKYGCDLVLTDLSMPGVNGYELAQLIKELNPGIPVFLITGWNQLDRKFMQANQVIDGIIEKPFNMDQVRGQIEKFFDKHRQQQRPAHSHS